MSPPKTHTHTHTHTHLSTCYIHSRLLDHVSHYKVDQTGFKQSAHTDKAAAYPLQLKPRNYKMMEHRARERKSDKVKKPKASENIKMAHRETNGSKLFITGEMSSAWLFDL